MQVHMRGQWRQQVQASGALQVSATARRAVATAQALRGVLSGMLALALAAIISGCSRRPEAPTAPLLVAAASNLSSVLDPLAADFTRQSGIRVSLNYGSTAQLAQQIEHGAPFDLFLSADVEHVDKLVAAGHAAKDSRAIYARGKVALWVPPGSKAAIASLTDLRTPGVRFIAIANPETAPYGAAAEKLLRAAGLWDTLQPKLVRADNVTAAKQMASTGNADAAFTAYSLVFKEAGRLVPLDGAPLPAAPLIDQALGIPTQAPQPSAARQFADYLLHGAGRDTLRAAGYELP